MTHVQHPTTLDKHNNQKKLIAVDENFWVAPQISAVDIPEILEKDIKTIICNRPDEELSSLMSESPPIFDSIKDTFVIQPDIRLIYQPIQQISDREITSFADILQNTQQPVLAYCASGTRSIILWALVQTLILHRAKSEIIDITAIAGYDTSPYFM